MAIWYKNFPPTTLKQATSLHQELKEEGVISKSDQVIRFMELIPEEATKRYWDPARKEFGRLLRLLTVPGKRKRGGTEDSGEAPVSTRSKLTKDLSTNELMRFISSRSIVDNELIHYVTGKVSAEVEYKNRARQAAGAEPFKPDAKIGTVVDPIEVVLKHIKEGMLYVTGVRKEKEEKTKPPRA